MISPRLGDRAIDGDGVVGATGMVAGRPIACYAQDGSVPRRLARRASRRHDRPRAADGRARARIPVVGFVESGGARMQEGTAALAGYGRIFRHTVGADRSRPADLDRVGRVGRRRRVLAGADRPDPDDRGRGDVPHRARRGSRGARRGDRRGRARRSARARPKRRLPPGRARRAAPRPRAFASCSATCRRRRARRRRVVASVAPELDDPGPCRPGRAATRLRRARRAARDRRRRLAARAVPAVGAQRRHGAGPARRAPGRRSSPTSRITSAACSTPWAPRRPRGSSTSATRSACR